MTITIADGRGALWQWDTGRRVKITDGVGVKQIHYQNRCFGSSVDVDVEDDGTAIIPDELLQDYHTLTAYAYATDDTGAYTMVQQDFAVYKRAKPADYVYTPTEHAGFDRLRSEIGDLADLTTEAQDTLVAAINEVALSSGTGSMSLRVADGYIQYSTDSGSTWQNLIALAELKGAKGDPGVDGVTPRIGDNGNWYLGENDTGKPSRGATGVPGKDGQKGDTGAAGQDGHSPVVTATKSGKTTTISVDGAAIATVEDGADGGSVPKPLTYDYMPDGYPKKSVLFDIEWDGDTSGLVSAAGIYYKVANYTAVTKADLVGCMLSMQNDPEHPEPFAIKGEDIYDTQIPNVIMVSDYVLFVSEPTSYGQFNFTESGVYFSKMGEMYTARLSKQTTTTIAEEFLPPTAKNTTVFHSDFVTLKHDDGTLVTAQEAYDAFMNTRVLIMLEDRIYQAISMLWYDNNSEQTDHTNVGYAQLTYVSVNGSGTIILINDDVGDSSLVPAQQV